jgi:hypothetical protein
MNHIATITFQDADEHCEAAAIVRADADHIVLALTLQTNGDAQVVITRDVAQRYIPPWERLFHHTSELATLAA